MGGIVAGAINAHFDRFGRFPESHNSGLDTGTDSSAGSDLIKVLAGGDGKPACEALGMLPAHEKAGRYFYGLHEDKHGGIAFLDRWGNPFRVIMDTNGDGVISDPSAPDRKVKEKVIVWSGGPDGDPNTWSDNAATWLEVK